MPAILVTWHTVMQNLPFPPSIGHNRLQYSFCIFAEGWLSWVYPGGLVTYENGIPANSRTSLYLASIM